MTGLYSPINKLMEQVTRPKGTGAEYMAELQKKPGYKPAEAEDRDLQALMALPQMQRAEFMEKLKAQANKYPLKQRVLEGAQTHHDKYTLPGGENYREILLHTPMPEGKGFEGRSYHFGGMPNILASVRVKDRTSPEGKKVLHIEEIQSDWHQQGREGGYLPKDFEKQVKEARNWRNRLQKESTFSMDKYEYAEHQKALEESEAELEKLEQLKYESVPYGPHAKDWHELALKAMIQHAAEKGYDQIAITPGAEQAKRFGLSKQVEAVSLSAMDNGKYLITAQLKGGATRAEPNLDANGVAAMIGKDLASKLISAAHAGMESSAAMRAAAKSGDDAEYDRLREARKELPPTRLSGLDLDIGGEGMKGFYDKMVPTFLNKFGKKHGVQVQQGRLPGDPSERGNAAEALGVAHVPLAGMAPEQVAAFNQRLDEHNARTVHRFDITPAMREDVLKNGIPRYAEGGGVEVKPTTYDPTLQRRHPELEEAIRGVAAGTVTHKQLDKLIAKHKPIKPYEFVPKPATYEDAQRGLNKKQILAWRSHEGWPDKTKIGGRLDINAYEHQGVWANSIHDESGEGRPTSYGPVISIKNATFDGSPSKAEKVGTGENRKAPFARIRGELHHMTEDEAVQHMVDNLHHPDYAQVGYDPRRHGQFYDRKTKQPVASSPHVVQIGPLALAYKPVYAKRESYAEGGDVSRGTVKEKVTITPDMDVMQYELINRKAK